MISRPAHRLRALGVALTAVVMPWSLAHAAHTPGPPHEPYNRHDYVLSYKVFLNAGHVHAALRVARAAVQSRPGAIAWQRRLAQTALWTGHDHTALRAMVYLARHGQIAYLKPAWTLASGLSAFTRLTELLALRLKRHPGAPALILEMSRLYQIQGHPHRAIAWLQEAMRKNPHRRYLWSIITLDYSLGAQTDERAALCAYTRRYGATSRVLLTEASLFYRRGQVGRAYRLLASHADAVSTRHFAYYHTLGALAWMRQDFSAARAAAQALYARGLATQGDLAHLVLLDEHRHPRSAYLLALAGFRRYHTPVFFFAMLGLALRLHAHAWLIETFAQVRPGHDAALTGNPYYWTGLAHYWAVQGRDRKAEHVYREALRRFPQNTAILGSYLWFFVATGRASHLAATQLTWARTVDRNRSLWLPYALCFLTLNEPRLALPYLQNLVRRHPNDPRLLLPLADSLAKDGRAGAAVAVRRRAFAILLGAGGPSANHPRARHKARRRAALAVDLATAPTVMAWLAAESPDRATPARRDILLGYALSRAAYAPADYAAPNGGHAPPWAALAVALAGHDGMRVRALLVRHDLTLPRTARAEAAAAVGEPARAISLAFASLGESRSDIALMRQYRRLALRQSDRLSSQVQYLRAAGFSAQSEELAVRHALNPGTAIEAGTVNSLDGRTDPALIGVIPRFDRSEYVGLVARRPSGRYHLTVGSRLAVARFLYAKVSWQTAFWPHSAQTLRVNYHARAYDLPSLYLGGVKNGVSMADEEALTVRDTVNGRLSYRQLRGQGGGALATGVIGAFHYDHKIFLSYPDITVGAALSFAHYRAAGDTLPAALVPLLPPGGGGGIGFFVPQSYAQAGLDVHFGDTYRRHYAPGLRPFLDLEVFDNSVTHAGYDLLVGVATPILGPDHLAAYYTRSQGGIGIENRLQAVGVRYDYHFKP